MYSAVRGSNPAPQADPGQILASSYNLSWGPRALGFLETYKTGIMTPVFIRDFSWQIFIKFLQSIRHCAGNMEVKKISPALREPEFNPEDNKIFKSEIYAVCQISATEKNKAGDGDREYLAWGKDKLLFATGGQVILRTFSGIRIFARIKLDNWQCWCAVSTQKDSQHWS